MEYIDKKTNTKYIKIENFNNNKNEELFPVVSLFSGAGGLDIGLEDSGFHTAVCVEYDQDCRENA